MATLLHFDCRNPPTAWSTATLRIPLHSLEPTPPDGTVNVFSWTGDGTCSADEHISGSLLGSVTALPGEYPVAEIDVTTELTQALGNGDPFLSFRLMGVAGGDRYDVGTFGGVENPTVVLAP